MGNASIYGAGPASVGHCQQAYISIMLWKIHAGWVHRFVGPALFFAGLHQMLYLVMPIIHLAVPATFVSFIYHATEDGCRLHLPGLGSISSESPNSGKACPVHEKITHQKLCAGWVHGDRGRGSLRRAPPNRGVHDLQLRHASHRPDHQLLCQDPVHVQQGPSAAPSSSAAPTAQLPGWPAQHSQCYAAWYSHVPGLKVRPGGCSLLGLAPAPWIALLQDPGIFAVFSIHAAGRALVLRSLLQCPSISVLFVSFSEALRR